MAIHVALHHRSRYTYDRPVGHSPHVIRLRPAPHCRTPILSYSLKVRPAQQFLNWQQDPFGNYLARLVFPDPAAELVVEVDLVAEMAVYNPFDFFLEPSAEKVPFDYEASLREDLKPFLTASAAGPRQRAWLDQLAGREERTIDFLVRLNQRLWREVKYVIRLEPGVQTPEETLERGSGSCRDSAWLLVQLLRHLGIAARFASGYLIQLKPDVRSLDGPSGAEEDFTDLHAWCEVYLPGAGWIGLDPTSGLLAGEGHLPLACTPEPISAAPITGATDPCEATFEHAMRVRRIYESPRVTKPYEESAWEEIVRLGHRIDEELRGGDVRLTVGGEPTFIAIDHMDGEEWNFAAVGPEKRRLSAELIRRLQARFAPGGVLHHGQGKWYPGESLPRWAYACYWRVDGEPIWADASLLALPHVDYGHSERDAQRFITRLARVLELPVDHIMPAYEDAWYHLWRERCLPSNVDPLQSRLDDPEERARLARVFEQGLKKIVGYALPLRREGPVGHRRWETGRWFLRREHCFLIPGDSPMGLRLPLDSVPWAAPGDRPWLYPPDPTLGRPPLPGRPPLRQSAVVVAVPGDRGADPDLAARGQALGAGEEGAGEARVDASGGADRGERTPGPHQSADWIVRTALCVEPRGGRLHVFLPPVGATEDFLDLVGAIEQTAAELRLPVMLEGEAPGYDPRLKVIKVTPDPGVIEVNVPPAASWDELVRDTTALYEEARVCRLGTEKFLLDGRHVGTGGGNHIVVGGPTPADSPLLRRPDLLRSLLGYWQNHPSLSFLLSGLFIGPTSQHPRVDEARHESLYELEVAFRELERQLAGGVRVPPWLVDRLFRHLLIDATGNTHRAEFCIDKLYSPEGAAGRLGLLELRAFEMPPHARMSLVQHLLLRALVAWFWREPWSRSLVRWGTELHDRFMLPHFIEQDFAEVLEDLAGAGYPLQASWFGPHFEFRFPRYGEIARRGVHLELRQALEPWHVLGEQGHAGSTVRYVDSSLERLQVRARGLIDTRHVVCCNGRPVPLHPTGTEGEGVAGVRFRAWQPPECLQPTIGVQAPLTFDIVDTWNQRSIGGCTYHVAHPGGRNYTTLPVNAYEAESRRLARFFAHGHSPGRLAPPAVERHPEFPYTLDLRWPSREGR